MRPVSPQNAIEVVNEIPPALTIWADAALLSEVFQNLLGTYVARDNGAGIPPEMLAQVFGKLATDPHKAGTGLGLVIVKQIVEAHGGTVSAESTYGADAKALSVMKAAQSS